MKKIGKALRWVLTILLVIVLVINIWMLFARLVLHQDLPRVFGYSNAVVLSGSMEPTFSAGDMLIFKEQENYTTNDIIIFMQDDYYITHRIIDTNQDCFITKGDANNSQDANEVRNQDICGKLVLIIPKIGKILSFLKSPAGILVLIVFGMALIEIPRAIDDRRKRVET